MEGRCVEWQAESEIEEISLSQELHEEGPSLSLSLRLEPVLKALEWHVKSRVLFCLAAASFSRGSDDAEPRVPPAPTLKQPPAAQGVDGCLTSERRIRCGSRGCMMVHGQQVQ